MKSRRVILCTMAGMLLGRATLAFAAGGAAPWDDQMTVIWQSITGGPFAALVLGTGIIGIGMALMASEHGSLWRGLPVAAIGGVLIAGSQTLIPQFFTFGGALAIPM
jgi:type IV secretory pathway VirB2 component (pilin)